MALKYIYNEEILVDALFGKQTQGVINTVFEKLQIATPITTKVNYLKFLDLTGKIAFELVKKKNTPIQLLENLTEVLKNLPLANKNNALKAFNSFIDHDETALCLDTFEHHPNRNVDTIISNIVA